MQVDLVSFQKNVELHMAWLDERREELRKMVSDIEREIDGNIKISDALYECLGALKAALDTAR